MLEGAALRSAHDMSVEELIDLEQQAEFFIVLGQEEEAIDLLVGHIRHTGGTSPLPYLKLLEIYHERGDRENYERTRGRFNQRFNAWAPDWDVGLQQGEDLLAHPRVLLALQRAWPRPLDAMAELEALLFRKDAGVVFELPAYRDLMFLYSLARDLFDREGARLPGVDLLLPLSAGALPAMARPIPVLREDAAIGGPERAVQEEAPTTPVDLDLSGDTDTGGLIVTVPPSTRGRQPRG